MIEAITGLSALGAGILAPAVIRRPTAVAPSEAARRPIEPAEDRFELSPHHTYEAGEEYPYLNPAYSSIEEAPSEEGAGDSVAVADAATELTPEEKRQVAELKKRDREVRAHEQAHRAAGGAYTGSASYTYQTGPDGKRYATSGEVPIDASPVPGDPKATIAKMQQVRRAALAPAQPSAQDRRVAAQASQIEREARAELTRQPSHAAGNRPVCKPGGRYPAGRTDEPGTLIDVAA